MRISRSCGWRDHHVQCAMASGRALPPHLVAGEMIVGQPLIDETIVYVKEEILIHRCPDRKNWGVRLAF